MIGIALTSAGLALLITSIWVPLPGRFGVIAISNGMIVAGDVVDRWWWGVAINGACAIVAALAWWRRRKDRKRSRDALGAKSRALRDALVAKVRERSTPRPVLRPVPGGAR